MRVFRVLQIIRIESDKFVLLKGSVMTQTQLLAGNQVGAVSVLNLVNIVRAELN